MIGNMKRITKLNRRYYAGFSILSRRSTGEKSIDSFSKNVFTHGDISLTPKAICHICDIGCGNGIKSAIFFKNALKHFAGTIHLDIIEPNSDYLKEAIVNLTKIRSPRLKIKSYHCSAEKFLQKPTKKYDLILASHVFYHLPLNLIFKFLELLNSNGHLVIITRSSKSSIAILCNLFKPFTTSEKILEYIAQNAGKRSFASIKYLSDIPASLDLSGLTFTQNKADLSEELKNLFGVLLAQDIDNLTNTQYKKIKNIIVRLKNKNILPINYSAIIMVSDPDS